jgi:CrcB protein
LYGIVKGMQFVAVALAGAAGALLRWQIGTAVSSRSFHWSTLSINLVGSFVLAFLLAGPASNRWSDTTTLAISVGLIGSFTTFSTFGYETVTLVRDQRIAIAAMYVLVSFVGGIGLAGVGYLLGRSISG